MPTRSSNARIRMDSVGWVMNSDSAAAVMVPWCTTAQNVSMSRFVIAPASVKYKYLFIFYTRIFNFTSCIFCAIIRMYSGNLLFSL